MSEQSVCVSSGARAGSPRALVCPNAYKGSLTASLAARAIAEGIAAAGRNASVALRTTLLPLADGGDGTLETLVEATGGTLHTAWVTGPLGRQVKAAWGRLGGDRRDTAVIEMAQASGLRLLRTEERDIARATTFGTGELILAAIRAGCTTLVVGIGGSATNDGGAGMAQALGFRLLDSYGADLPPGGGALDQLAHIDSRSARIPPGLRVIAACDVDNPLTGPDGAAAVYGPQKGATPDWVARLDAGLECLAEVWRTELGADVAAIPGSGAAGGLGGGLMAFCRGTLQPGADIVLDLTQFDKALDDAALVVTGEGRLDGQTARGKVVAAVARRARGAGIPVVALAGSLAPGAEEALRLEGVSAALCILDSPMALDEAMGDAYRLLVGASERMMRLLDVGRVAGLAG